MWKNYSRSTFSQNLYRTAAVSHQQDHHGALIITAWKLSKYGVFSGQFFLYSDCIQTFGEWISMFSPNTGKYRTENTPYLNTFHVVYSYNKVRKASTDPPQRHATKTLFLFSFFLVFFWEKECPIYINFIFFYVTASYIKF